MNSPPRLASWPLNHLLLGERRASLIGDLVERYAKRPSPLWFWLQALTAIGVNFVAQARAHIWLVGAVFAINYYLPNIFAVLLGRWLHMSERLWQPRLLTWLSEADRYGLYAESLSLLRYLQMTFIYCGVLSAFAFILVRLRPNLRGLLLSVLLVSAIMQGLPNFLSDVEAWVGGEPTNAMWFRKLFVQSLFAFVAVPYSILRGGRVRSEMT